MKNKQNYELRKSDLIPVKGLVKYFTRNGELFESNLDRFAKEISLESSPLSDKYRLRSLGLLAYNAALIGSIALGVPALLEKLAAN